MAENSKKYTAFRVPGSGLWQYNRMPFRLMNALMTFQRLIDKLFGPELKPYVFGYLDDIIVVTSTFEDHLHYLELVLSRLIQSGFEVRRDKCEFCVPELTYLGFMLDQHGLRPDPAKVEPILEYPAPKNVK